MEAFLTREERSKVQRMYQIWLDYLKPDHLAERLFTEDILSIREKQEYEAKTTDYDRSDHLFSCCLIRATYPDLMKIREILYDTEQHMLADKIPIRGPPPQR